MFRRIIIAIGLIFFNLNLLYADFDSATDMQALTVSGSFTQTQNNFKAMDGTSGLSFKKLVVGDDTAADMQIDFKGNAQDFHIGLDDTDDDLKIGLGTTLGTTPFLTITEDGDMTFSGTTPALTVGDAGAEDAQINFDGNAQNYHIGLQDSTDDLTIGKGTTLGTTTSMSFNENGEVTMPLQPSFFVSATAMTNIAVAGGAVDVTWGIPDFDIGSNFNTSTDSFVAPVDGKYQFNAFIQLQSVDSAATGITMFFVASNRSPGAGSLEPDNILIADGEWYIMSSTLVDMDASDTMKMTIDIVGGADQTDLTGSSQFNGVKVN